MIPRFGFGRSSCTIAQQEAASDPIALALHAAARTPDAAAPHKDHSARPPRPYFTTTFCLPVSPALSCEVAGADQRK